MTELCSQCNIKMDFIEEKIHDHYFICPKCNRRKFFQAYCSECKAEIYERSVSDLDTQRLMFWDQEGFKAFPVCVECRERLIKEGVNPEQFTDPKTWERFINCTHPRLKHEKDSRINYCYTCHRYIKNPKFVKKKVKKQLTLF